MIRLTLLLLPLIMVVTEAQAITAEELRLIAGQADREDRLRASRINPNDLSSLLPKMNQPAPPVTLSPKKAHQKSGKPVSKKYTQQPKTSAIKKTTLKPISPSTQAATQVAKLSIAPSTTKPDNVYIPPPRIANTKTHTYTDAEPIAKQQTYGIRMGAWLPARLERNATSADPGRVEIVLIKTVQGDHQTLPAGTLLFAEKAYNQGTQKLDMQVVKAITPQGDEITLKGLVYDAGRAAGLQGIVNGNPITTSVKSGVSRGLLDASRVMFASLSTDAAVGTVVNATTDAVIRDQQAVLDVQSPQPYTIHVTAQDVLVRVEETF